MTASEAKRVVREFLEADFGGSLPKGTKITAQTVSFQDLARANGVYAQVKMPAGQMLTLEHEGNLKKALRVQGIIFVQNLT